MEIRPIRPGEAIPFLQLLCEVFELEYERASNVFFGEPMFDLHRKWALFDGGQMATILTTVPVEFGIVKGIGIAGVATRRDRWHQGLACRLLDYVVSHSERQGEPAAWLFARNQSLYRKCGFVEVDEVIHADLGGDIDAESRELLAFDDIRRTYDDWSLRHAERLRRDDQRWNYWKWNLRPTTAFADGYICHEGFHVRECVVENRREPWKFPANSKWAGLRSMAKRLELPIVEPKHDIFLMARGADWQPQMFLTDQF